MIRLVFYDMWCFKIVGCCTICKLLYDMWAVDWYVGFCMICWLL